MDKKQESRMKQRFEFLKPLILDLADEYYDNSHGVLDETIDSKVKEFFIKAVMKEWEKSFYASFVYGEDWTPEILQSVTWDICRKVEETKGLTKEKIIQRIEEIGGKNGEDVHFEELDMATQHILLIAFYRALDAELRSGRTKM